MPSYKLDRKVVAAEIDIVKEMGADIKCGVEVGKDITIEELRNQGLTDEQISFVMAENGKDIQKVKADLATAQADRDKYKKAAEDAEEALKKLEESTDDTVKAQVEEWKKKAEEAEASFMQTH